MMHVSGTLTNEIHQHILGLGEHFSIGSHLRVAYRCVGIQCEYLDYAKTPESTGYPNLAKRIFYREQMYSDFISESARGLADAVQHNLQDSNQLSPTYALLSRIRLSSSTTVLASAERVIQHIVSAYSEPNVRPEEMQSRAARREDPLREFSSICRA